MRTLPPLCSLGFKNTVHRLRKHCIINVTWNPHETDMAPIIQSWKKASQSVHVGLCLIFIQFSSVAQLCLTLCHPIDCSMPAFLILHYLLEFAQTHVYWVGDPIQTTYPLSLPSPSALNRSQQQSLIQWVGSLHQVTQVLELQLQQQSFQWIFRIDFL